MKYGAEIEGRTFEFEFAWQGGRLLARCGERTFDIDFEMIGDGGAFSLIVGDRVFDAIVERDKRGLSVEMQGQRHRVVVEDEHERAARAVRPVTAHGKQTIVAAMPGAVVEVMVEVGQSVEAGQTLLVLEAMKMQNPVLADGAGKVVRVCVVAGASVAAGDLLVEIEAG